MPVDTTPMFPLGTVLVPGGLMPLHVFEPRYRELVRTCLDDDREFGVVLIARGSEVGGGEVRTDVGCLARIQTARETPDGRYGILCAGTTRIRVVEWLPDDPYPQARTEPWPDEPDDVSDDDLAARAEALAVLLRRTLALGSEAGLRVPPATIELSSDPATLSFQAAALAPLGALDMYEALAEPSTSARLDAVTRAVASARELIEMQLRAAAAGDDD